MTNEEYKNKNNEFLEALEAKENDINSNIKDLFDGISLPTCTPIFSKKMNELLDVFDSDGKPLDQHLIVIMESKYLYAKYAYLIMDIQTFFNNLVVALCNKDNAKVKEMLDSESAKEEQWRQLSEELAAFDIRINLKDVIESGLPIPQDIPKEKALQICTAELDKIAYTPKGPNDVAQAK